MFRLFVKLETELPTVASVAAAGKIELFYRRAPAWRATDADCADHMLESFPDDITNDEVDEKWTYMKLRVPKGYYQNVQHVGEVISRQFDNAYGTYGAHLEMEMDYATGYIKFKPRGCKVVMFDTTKYLTDLLGIPSTKFREEDYSTYRSEYGVTTLFMVSKSFAGNRKSRLEVMHSMYVYSDMIETQPVGDVEAPLLGIAPVGPAQPGERVHYAFNPLSYLPLSASFMRTIRIELRTDRGDPVPFAAASDNVVCCIRLRRARRTNTFAV
jgi:hypothetical protein